MQSFLFTLMKKYKKQQQLFQVPQQNALGNEVSETEDKKFTSEPFQPAGRRTGKLPRLGW